MRLFLLVLPVLAFLPQVTPAYRGKRECWGKAGQCRRRCEDTEMTRGKCKNHQACCVPVNKDHEPQAERKTKNTIPASSSFSDHTTTTTTISMPTMNPSNLEDEDVNETQYPFSYFSTSSQTSLKFTEQTTDSDRVMRIPPRPQQHELLDNNNKHDYTEPLPIPTNMRYNNTTTNNYTEPLPIPTNMRYNNTTTNYTEPLPIPTNMI